MKQIKYEYFCRKIKIASLMYILLLKGSIYIVFFFLTKLDSSGEARLSNSTLTFTNKGPKNL